ncbi:MAG: DNA-3-methyladenine glycosylase [Nanoarchaeota archaeon]|nr:DNA-3-methyladenine glycosylase [Nanoarchaeota archaeon]
MKLSEDFFKRDAVVVAKELLGKVISYNGCSGVIVETEAYKRDPASHAYKITPRSKIMLETFGRWYIYFIYGMYFCLNITTNDKDVGAVLIRAIEPIDGISKMKKRRSANKVKSLCSGPSKLCQAFGISNELNGQGLDVIKVYEGKKVNKVVRSGRIGIKEEKVLPWRFYIKGNEWVSRK